MKLYKISDVMFKDLETAAVHSLAYFSNLAENLKIGRDDLEKIVRAGDGDSVVIEIKDNVTEKVTATMVSQVTEKIDNYELKQELEMKVSDLIIGFGELKYNRADGNNVYYTLSFDVMGRPIKISYILNLESPQFKFQYNGKEYYMNKASLLGFVNDCQEVSI